MSAPVPAEQKALRVEMRLLEARRVLYLHGVLTETENRRIKARIAGAAARLAAQAQKETR